MINAKIVILAPTSDTTNIQTDAGYLRGRRSLFTIIAIIVFLENSPAANPQYQRFGSLHTDIYRGEYGL